MLGRRELGRRIDLHLGIGETWDGRPIHPVDQSRIRHEVLMAVCIAFGGCSVTDQQGGWVSASGRLVVERGITVTAYPRHRHGDEYLEGLCLDLLRTTQQRAMILVRDGEAVELSLADEDRT